MTEYWHTEETRLTEHPSRAELSALFREGLTLEREAEVLLHLLQPCSDCLAQAPDDLRVLLELGPESSREAAEREAAVERAFRTALHHERHLRRQRKEARTAEKILAQEGNTVPEQLPRRLGALAKMEALLARSWSLRHEDTQLMVELASLAVHWAQRLEPQTYGAERVFDFQCRALAELGNAYRVADQLRDAGIFLERARQIFELGTGDEFLDARLLSLEASLDADCRRFGAACQKLSRAYDLHLRNGDAHLAGRALVKQGLYKSNAGETAAALRLLNESLALIDEAREPSLAYAARHNIVWALLDAGDPQEAERWLSSVRRLQPHAGGRNVELRLRWTEGRIEAGLGRAARAEEVLREARDGFLEAGRAYDSALAALDLAAVLLARSRPGEAAEVVFAACQVFAALSIGREALAAVVMLRTAFEKQRATREMVEEVAGFLRRSENDPRARFAGRAWETGSG